MIRPYRRLPRPTHEVAVVGDDLRAHYEDGRVRHFHHPRDGVRYYMRTEHARDLSRRGVGRLRLYEGRPYELHESGRTIYLGRSLPNDPDRTLAALVMWRDWAQACGAEVSGIRATSRSILRATLERPLTQGSGDVPPLTETIGGRIEAFTPPGDYGAVLGLDMQAAYARTLGRLAWGGWWYETEPGLFDEPYDLPTFHEARVAIDPATFGPLPVRNTPERAAEVARLGMWASVRRSYPTDTILDGIWSQDELRQAVAVGSLVDVRRTWTMPGTREPFAGWWRHIMAGRELPNLDARKLAKLTGNVLWGSFLSGGGSRTEIYTTGDELREREVPMPGMPDYMVDTALAETVTASVRARVLHDLIRPHAKRLLSIHTDGGILTGHRAPAGSGALGWRVKYRADRLVYIGPTTYAYRGPVGTWTYVMGGIPTDDAADVFWPFANDVLTKYDRRPA